MDNALCVQLNDRLQELSQWRCSLFFPDQRASDGRVDLMDYADINAFNASTEKVNIPGSFPPNTAYGFDPEIYNNGPASADRLKNDILEASRLCGFEILVESSSSNKSKSAIREVRFCCSRGVPYNGKRIAQLKSVSEEQGGVLLPGIKTQTLRRSRKSSQKSLSAAGTDRCAVGSYHSMSRKTHTVRPTTLEDCCPFKFVVFLSNDSRWYVRLSYRKHGIGICHRTHLGHCKLDGGHLITRMSVLSEVELERIKHQQSVHLTSTQSARLITLSTSLNVVPSQIKYLARKASDASAKLSADASSADELLSYLDSRDDVSYIMLTDDRTNSLGGLCVTVGRGRPRKRTVEPFSDVALTSSFDGPKIRQKMKLTDQQSLLLAIAWITDTELRLVSMFPEVLYMDVTSQTNNEKRGLFLVAGKDGNGEAFTALRIYLPSEQKWVFQWIFSHCLPFLMGNKVLSRNHLCITDGDKNEYDSLGDQFSESTSWCSSAHILCEWHLLPSQWRKGVLSKVKDSPLQKQIASIAYRWIQTWFNYIENIAEFEMSYRLLMSWLQTDTSPDSSSTAESIRNFIIQKLLPLKNKWLRCYRISRRGFDEKSNSLVESQNSAMKHGSMAVRPNMSIATAAQTMLDQSQMLHAKKSIRHASKCVSTSLWSCSTTSKELTSYAEGIVAQNFERRVMYSCVQVAATYLCTATVSKEQWLVKYNTSLEKEHIKRRTLTPLDSDVIPRFRRVRKVCLVETKFLMCTCHFFDRMGLPCCHILKVLNTLAPEMCHIRWWKRYMYYYRLDDKLTNTFDQMLSSISPGVPCPEEWVTMNAACDFQLPLLVDAVSEAEYLAMVAIDSMTTPCLVEEAPSTAASPREDHSTASAQFSSGGLTTTFSCSTDHAILANGTASETQPNSFSNLKRKFELLYNIYSDSDERLDFLSQNMSNLITAGLLEKDSLNRRSSKSTFVSLFPQMDRRKKSKNHCT